MSENTAPIRMIPLSKLLPSPANVRKTAREAGIEELAASIAAHGLLQNLTVRPVLDDTGNDTGKFEVVAGARRFAALKLLAKRKVIAKSHLVPCALLGSISAEEASLAENVFQCPMHPADQYDAFAKLHAEQAMPVEDIAARFGVSPTVVRQRLKLAAVSPTLMQIYREGSMTLEQLMAFTITDDHAIQERVWMSLSYNKSREMIRRLLTEGQVSAADRRARFIGSAAYEAAGGLIIRDLFDDEHEGYFDDPALLDRLVQEKLEKTAEVVVTEGWKWVTVTPEFNYALTSSLRRIHPKPVVLSEAQEAEMQVLEAEYEALSIQHESEEAPPEIEAEFQRLDAAINALRGDERFYPEDMAIAGAFVSLGFDAEVRIERGFVRPEDDPVAEAPANGRPSVESGNGHFDPDLRPGGESDETDGSTSLSDRLLTELTAYRTAGLRDALGQNPEIALIALLHTLTLRIFYDYSRDSSLEITIRHTELEPYASGIAESRAERNIAARHKRWTKRLPKNADDLCAHLSDLDRDARLNLLAYCLSLTINAVSLPGQHDSGLPGAADMLAQTVCLDMSTYWQPTAANYFSRVTKAHILDVVREAVSNSAAERIAGLKKQPMAEAAEQLLKDTGWLPPVLRTPDIREEVAETRRTGSDIAAAA